MWAIEGEGIPPLVMLSHNDVAHCGTAKKANLGKIKIRPKKAITTLFEQYARIEGVYTKNKEERSCEYAKILW